MAVTQEAGVHLKLNAVDNEQAENMLQVFEAERKLLVSMEADCRRLEELQEANRQLEAQKTKLQAALLEQQAQMAAAEAAKMAAPPPPPTTLTELTNCPKCHSPYLPGSSFCRQCGEARKSVPTHCQYCGNEYLPDANYCRKCGNHRHNTPTTVELGYSLPNHRPGAGGPGTDSPFRFEKSIRIHSAQVHGVAMGKSSEVIATASWDQSVKLFHLRANEVVRTFSTATGGAAGPEQELRGLYSVAFSKTSDDLIGCTSSDRSVYLWNHETGVLKHRFVGHTNEVNDLDFHANQQIMATASDDCKCLIWDVHEGIVLRTLDKHYKQVYGCTFLGHMNQFLVATGSFDQFVRIFDMRDKSEAKSIKEHTDDVIGLDYCSQKQLLVTGSDDGTICCWDARMGWKLLRKINTSEIGKQNEVKRVAFSPSGAMLAAASSTGEVLVFDADAGKLLAQLDGHTECVFDVAWGVDSHTNEKVLVSASHDMTCRQWRAALN